MCALVHVRPYQLNLTFHGSADSIFVMSNKKIIMCSSASVSNLGGEAVWLAAHSVVPRLGRSQLPRGHGPRWQPRSLV